MSYIRLTDKGYQALASLFIEDYNAFIKGTRQVVLSTQERYKLLFNDTPIEFEIVRALLEIDMPLNHQECHDILNNVSTVQYRIYQKEQSFKTDDSKPVNNNNKTRKIMKNSKNTVINGTDKVVSATFGTAHFVFQSLADMTATAEASVRVKTSDKTFEEIVDARIRRTMLNQEKVKASVKSITTLSKESKDRVEQAIANATSNLKKMSETKSTTTLTKAEPSITTSSVS